MSNINCGNQPALGSLELNTRYGRLVIPDAEHDLIGRFLARYGEWAWLEAAFVASAIADGARVLDIGAFAGTFGLGLAQLRPMEFLCFVEANPDIVPLLERNVMQTSCPSLVLQALVAASASATRIGHSDPANLGSMSFVTNENPAAPGAVQALTLADLRAQYGSFDLMKLDVEGMESE